MFSSSKTTLLTALTLLSASPHCLLVDARVGVPAVNTSAARVLQELPQLQALGNNGNNGVFPLGLCQGDCDNDGECQDGLTCLQRSPGDAVPGCNGNLMIEIDFCVKPVLDAATVGPTLAETTMTPTEGATMGPTVADTTMTPTDAGTMGPTEGATVGPTVAETTMAPTEGATMGPTVAETQSATMPPTEGATMGPTVAETQSATMGPTLADSTMVPTQAETQAATAVKELELSTGAPTESATQDMIIITPEASVAPTDAASDAPTADTTIAATSIATVVPTADESMVTATAVPTVVATAGVFPLATVGNDGSFPAYPLSICEGDCDTDIDCIDEMICFQRVMDELVPGCEGIGDFSIDYCVDAFRVDTARDGTAR